MNKIPGPLILFIWSLGPSICFLVPRYGLTEPLNIAGSYGGGRIIRFLLHSSSVARETVGWAGLPATGVVLIAFPRLSPDLAQDACPIAGLCLPLTYAPLQLQVNSANICLHRSTHLPHLCSPCNQVLWALPH